MKTIIKQTITILIIALIIVQTHSCVDPQYDLSKGVDTEISIGGDTLGIPLGKLDTIYLKDVLNPEDIDFLTIFEDGGYALNISDSFRINDLLKDINVDNLIVDADIPSILTKINFQKVDFGSFNIPEFTDHIDVNLNLPNIDVGDINPGSIELSEAIGIDFQGYSLQGINTSIENKSFNRTQDHILTASLAHYTADNHPEIAFQLDNPLDLDIDPIDLNYSIDVPNDITKINSIILENGAKIEIELFIENADIALKTGTFTPNCTIHIQDNFFELIQSGSESDKIILNQEHKLNNDNGYNSVKSIPIASLHNLPLAQNGSINLSNLISITGNIDANGVIKEDQIGYARNINLHVNIQIKDMVTDDIIFEIQNFTNSINQSSDFNITKENIPEEVAKIDILDFGATNSQNESYVTINILPTNLPSITNPVYTIENFDIKFPKEFKISSPGNTILDNSNNTICRITNKNLDPINGYSVKVYINEINFSNIPIELSSITFDTNIEYEGSIIVAGTTNTKTILDNTNYSIQLNATSNLNLNSITVVTNEIVKGFEKHTLNLQHEINTEDKNISYLGEVKVKPNTYLTIDIIQPDIPIPCSANNITLKFSDLYVFNDSRLTPENHLIIHGEIPNQIKLELKELHINQELVDGSITITDQFAIEGGYKVEGGNSINSKELAKLNDKKISFQATIPSMQIESVSVGMNSIEAEYTDIIKIDFEMDDFPKEILSLDSINFRSSAELELDINISNLPDLGDSPLNADILIKMPEIMKFKPGVLNDNNELIIHESFENGHLKHNVSILGFKLEDSELNGQLSINEEVSFDVTITIKNPTVNSDELNDREITVEVKVSLLDLVIETIYGKFNIDTDEIFEASSISFDDLPDYMKGDNVVLDILNPILALNTKSNLGFPFNADLTLTKYIGGKVQTDDIISLPFSLDKSDSPTQTTSSYVWYAPTNEGMPSEYSFVETPINNLLKPIPDSVKIDFQPNIDTNVQHVIDLTADYNVEIKYDMIIPMKFGKELVIMFKDTLYDIKLDFDNDDIEINSGKLEIIAKIINSIPLNLSMQMIMLDNKNNIISTTDSQTIVAGNKDGTGNTSEINIRVAEGFKRTYRNG